MTVYRPVDTGRKLNEHRRSDTSYVRSICVLCKRGGNAFLGLYVPVFETVLLNYKQIRRQNIGNTFFRTSSTGNWTRNKFDDGNACLDFNTVFSATWHHQVFAEIDEAKISIKLALSSSAADFKSGHNLFLLETFRIIKWCLFFRKRILNLLPKINIVLTFYRNAN